MRRLARPVRKVTRKVQQMREAPAPSSWLLTTNPENRRAALFQAALAREGELPAQILSYEDLLQEGVKPDVIPALPLVWKLDSPGENFAVEKGLLVRGLAQAETEGSPFLGETEIDKLSLDPGRILYPRQWYLGFVALLADLATARARPDVVCTWNASEISVMFDKARCHARCLAGGVPVPESPGEVRGFDELIARMEAAGWSRAFVKLAHGSSASGVVAFRFASRGQRLEAITSAEMVATEGEVKLYNSLRIRRYTTLSEVRTLIDTLARQKVHVERWLPKARLSDREMDVRVVVIGGHPRHLVVREGRCPMTNLHLGNRRGDAELLRTRLGEEGQASLAALAARAGRLFPRSLSVGVDIAIAPNFREFRVLEVNAFGDLLPGVMHEGRDTYAAQVAEVKAWDPEGTSI